MSNLVVINSPKIIAVCTPGKFEGMALFRELNTHVCYHSETQVSVKEGINVTRIYTPRDEGFDQLVKQRASICQDAEAVVAEYDLKPGQTIVEGGTRYSIRKNREQGLSLA